MEPRTGHDQYYPGHAGTWAGTRAWSLPTASQGIQTHLLLRLSLSARVVTRPLLSLATLVSSEEPTEQANNKPNAKMKTLLRDILQAAAHEDVRGC